MNEQYYTPDIEDLFLGYECETSFNNISWVKEIIDPFKYDFDLPPFLRTLYLTKEQIEKEGWVQNDWAGTVFRFSKGNHFLYWFIGIEEIKISSALVNGGIRYFGNCKSINEFRKLIKWLKI